MGIYVDEDSAVTATTPVSEPAGTAQGRASQ